MPDRNPYVNPGAISNSGANYFTNPKSKIYKRSMNIIDNGNELNNFLIEQFKKISYTPPNNQTMSSSTSNDFISILEFQKNQSRLNKLN